MRRTPEETEASASYAEEAIYQNLARLACRGHGVCRHPARSTQQALDRTHSADLRVDCAVSALRNFFTLTHFTNTGAAFGLFRDQGLLFVVIAFVVIVTIIVYARYLPIQQRLVRFALGLQLGGAIANNLIDRPRQGHVTDFIYFHFWPAFNIADMAIVSGVFLLAYALLIQKDEAPKPAGAEPGDQPTSS